MCVQLQDLSLTRNGTTLVQIHYFWTRLYVILWGGGIKFGSELEMTWRGKWNFFLISKSFDMWHRFCRNAFNGMKLDRIRNEKCLSFSVSSPREQQKKYLASIFFYCSRGEEREKETTLLKFCSQIVLVIIDNNFRSLL